jgi:hypothetical protein
MEDKKKAIETKQFEYGYTQNDTGNCYNFIVRSELGEILANKKSGEEPVFIKPIDSIITLIQSIDTLNVKISELTEELEKVKEEKNFWKISAEKGRPTEEQEYRIIVDNIYEFVRWIDEEDYYFSANPEYLGKIVDGEVIGITLDEAYGLFSNR